MSIEDDVEQMEELQGELTGMVLSAKAAVESYHAGQWGSSLKYLRTAHKRVTRAVALLAKLAEGRVTEMGDGEAERLGPVCLALVYVVQAATAARESFAAGEWPSSEKSLRSVQTRAAAALKLLGELESERR